MPEKYERGIDEILRRAGGGRRRRPASAHRGMSLPPRTFSETCLGVAILAALISGGCAYATGSGNLVISLIGLIGTVCIALVALSSFLEKPRSSSSRWQGIFTQHAAWCQSSVGICTRKNHMARLHATLVTPLTGPLGLFGTTCATALTLWAKYAAHLPAPWTEIELDVRDTGSNTGAAV